MTSVKELEGQARYYSTRNPAKAMTIAQRAYELQGRQQTQGWGNFGAYCETLGISDDCIEMYEDDAGKWHYKNVTC